MIRCGGTLFSILLLFFTSSGQDTVTVMHYNLLYYGTTTSFCTQTNNNLNGKAASLAEIIHHIKPDLLTVNEIATGTVSRQHLLDNVLNINGVNCYEGSAVTSLSGGSIGNALFFNGQKFALQSHNKLITSVRDIDLYKLWYHDPALWQHNDTAFLFVIVTHLKSGNTTANAAERAAAITILMDSACCWGGYPALFTGDFNLYGSAEPAWQLLTSPTDTLGEVFYDPIALNGSWHDNPVYASIHTQSTHASSNGCAAGGGLDDRFDFVLINKMLKRFPHHYRYVEGSYTIPGNDGNHLNQSINEGINTSAPVSVVQALYDASDHLPVILKLALPNASTGMPERTNMASFAGFRFQQGQLECRFYQTMTPGTIVLYDLAGRCMGSFPPITTSANAHWIAKPDRYLSEGFYIVQAITREGRVFNGKVMVTNGGSAR